MAINSLNSASKGLSGLASGMDTQSMVDAMLAGTQSKIDKQKATKTTLGYKRDIYRDVLNDLKSFQNSFFKYGSSTSLLYTSFYNSMSAASKSSAFKVTAGTSAGAGKTTINGITQLAQALKLKSELAKTTAEVEGELDLSKLKAEGSQIQFTLDGLTKTIKLPTGAEAATNELFVQQLNESIKKAFGNGVEVKLSADKKNIQFEGTHASREFSIMGTLDAVEALGIKSGVSNKINTKMYLKDINFNEKLTGEAFKFTINGAKIEATSGDTLGDVISKINSSDANVKVRYSALEDKFTIESTVSGEGTRIEMSQQEGNLLGAMFGLGTGGGVSGKGLYTYGDLAGKLPGFQGEVGSTPPSADDQLKINDLVTAMNTEIDRYGAAGNKFKLTVGGKAYELTLPLTPDPADAAKNLPLTIDDLAKAINGNAELAAQGVRLEIGKTTDGNNNYTGGMTLTAKPGVEVIVGDGMKLAGLSGSNAKPATAGSPAGSTGAAIPASTLESMGIPSLSVKVGGETLTFTGNQTLADVTKGMEAKLEEQSIAQKIPEAIAAAEKAAIAAGKPPLSQTEKDSITQMFTDNIKSKLSVEVLEVPPGSPGKFRIFGVDIPVTIEILGDKNKFLGTDRVELNKAGTAALQEVTKGQNAVLYVNGEKVERNSNDFTLEGMAFELKETFNEGFTGGVGTPEQIAKYASIDVTRNTDQIFDGVVKFMEEYNKLVDKVWGLLKAEPDYKDYPPLTDKQKESMSDKEVELWEKKSQSGLLRRDETLEGIMNAMRNVLNQKPAGAKYTLAQMGLTTGYDMEKGIGGKLEFNDVAKTGAKLKEMIAQEPQELEKLFSNYEDGLMTNLNRVVDATAKASVKGDQYGRLSLVDLAGSSTMPDTASRIYREVRDIDKNLESLNIKYKAEYSRYWKQFNSMEQMIQQMNQQSSWLTQQLGS